MPKAQGGKATTFEQDLHLMIHEAVSEKGDMSFELKVMSWIIDGKKAKPNLTKQQMTLGDDGSKRGGKAKGLSLTDVDKVIENLPAVWKALGGSEVRLNQLLAGLGTSTGAKKEDEPF